MVTTVELFSNNIKIKFGLKRCKTVNIIREKMEKGVDYVTSEGGLIVILGVLIGNYCVEQQLISNVRLK